MVSKTDTDDRDARKQSTDEIRRAIDKRNTSLDAPEADDGAAPPSEPGRKPNYVEFIDRKMQQRKKR